MRNVLALIVAGILLGAFTLVPHEVKAEGGSYWAKTYGGNGESVLNDVTVMPDGSIIAVGWTNSTGAGGEDALVMKLSPDGGVIWAKTYGGAQDDEAWAVAVAPNGDIIVAGYTSSFGAGSSDIWVLRLDENGNVKWQKTYGGNNWDVAIAMAVAPNGDILVAGDTGSFGVDFTDFWVLRLDGNGNVKWQKIFGKGNARAIIVAPDGDIVVAGDTDIFGAGSADIWVLRLDADGNVKWQKTYGGKNNEWPTSLALAPNGDIVVVGSTLSFGAGWYDAWILRLDQNGNVMWQKRYGGEYNDETWGVAVAQNGDLIVAGYTSSFGAGGYDAWVLRLDGDGNVKWQKTYGGKLGDKIYALDLTPKGDIVLAGSTLSFGTGWYDAWILRLPSDGNLPGCVFCQDSNAEVVDTNAKTVDSNAVAKESKAVVRESMAHPHLWTPNVKTQYPQSPTASSTTSTAPSTSSTASSTSPRIASTTSSTPSTTSSPSQVISSAPSPTPLHSPTTPSTSRTHSKGSICGPAALLGLALLPLLIRKRR